MALPLKTNQLAAATITAAQIAPSAITGAQMAPGSVGVRELTVGLATLPGTIVAFGGMAVPPNSGWLLCDGRPLNSAQYPALYAAISTNWGTGSVLPATE